MQTELFGIAEPTNTQRFFHVEMTWKRSFSHLFNVEYMWSVCTDEVTAHKML